MSTISVSRYSSKRRSFCISGFLIGGILAGIATFVVATMESHPWWVLSVTWFVSLFVIGLTRDTRNKVFANIPMGSFWVTTAIFIVLVILDVLTDIPF